MSILTQTPNAPKGYLTITQATKYLGISEHRTRHIVTKILADNGSKKQTVKRGKGTVTRWIVTKTALDAYNANKGGSKDGRAYAETRLNDAEIVKYNKWAKTNNMPAMVFHYDRMKAKKNK